VDTRLAEYVRGQWSTLVRYATLLCGDASEAEEIVQSTLTRVALRWRFVDDKDNPDGYVRRALVRACIDSGKRRRRESAVGVLPDPGVPDRSGQLADSDQVRRALATLPPRQRAVLVLRYLDDASEAKTADLLGCSVGTVKSQTSKGLAKLRVVLALPDEGPADGRDTSPAGSPHGPASSTEVRDR
jgi:RNA polymerase sigma-70 factor (sigma-E family)